MKGLVHYSDDSSSDEDIAQQKQTQVRQVGKGTQHVKPVTRNGSSVLENQSETEQKISQSNVYSNGKPSVSSAPISSSSTPQLSRDDHTLPTLPYPLPKPIIDVSSTLSYPEFLDRVLFHPPKPSSSLSRSNSSGSLGLSTSQRISLLKRSRSGFSGSGDDMGNGDINGVEDEWEARKRLCWPIPELEVPGLENYGIPESPGKEVDVGLIEQLQHYLILKASGISFNTSLLSNKSFKNPHIYQKLIKMLNLNEHGSNFMKERLDLEALKEKKEAFADELEKAQKSKHEKTQQQQVQQQRTQVAFTSSTIQNSSTISSSATLPASTFPIPGSGSTAAPGVGGGLPISSIGAGARAAAKTVAGKAVGKKGTGRWDQRR